MARFKNVMEMKELTILSGYRGYTDMYYLSAERTRPPCLLQSQCSCVEKHHEIVSRVMEWKLRQLPSAAFTK